MAGSLFDAARACLDAASPDDKVAMTHAIAAAFRGGALSVDTGRAAGADGHGGAGDAAGPEPIRMPGRPPRPRLVHPRELPRRGFGTDEGRAAFIHAIAHIEFNAIDLGWDAVYRFRDMPARYYADWVMVADDEARHFTMLRARLQAMDFDYGAFDAHNGLWEMAEKTAHDVLARMALVPRVLEARGLDVTPGMIVKLRALGDHATADILEVILREEVAHVAAGSRWFRWCCEREGIDPEPRFRELLIEYARAVLHGPFNVDARSAAGFSEDELAALQQLAG
ncbi:ferritin-like domain-containing protein [Luteimonas sp. MC1750]|uniref:ferritin-like domain-containing protein n=1 Tax=Luteimonas sp. MC1750 TaxID=2799326 RepID=UPI0018F08E21|nr:ferritin-like domain-containing protein [Luteimonas sp. MC1750]MBJ6983047.1 ferritin-like domain-containing protein [Luteimonas sp. MC1750]QQO05239.1 ferritin-like domain-containing protein [Luteimonas sp. MC1750]